MSSYLIKQMPSKRDCSASQIRNPKTNRCIKKCNGDLLPGLHSSSSLTCLPKCKSNQTRRTSKPRRCVLIHKRRKRQGFVTPPSQSRSKSKSKSMNRSKSLSESPPISLYRTPVSDPRESAFYDIEYKNKSSNMHVFSDKELEKNFGVDKKDFELVSRFSGDKPLKAQKIREYMDVIKK